MKKKQVYAIGALMMLSLLSFQAVTLGEDNTVNFYKVDSPFDYVQHALSGTTLKKVSSSQNKDSTSDIMPLLTDGSLFEGDYDFQNPAITSTGQSVLAVAELKDSFISADPVWRYSSDGGQTWSDFIGFNWEVGYKEKSCLDYCGNNEFQAYGGFLPDPSINDFYLIHYPSMTDLEATFNDDAGWTPWSFSVDGYYDGFEDIDVAGYTHGDIAPYPGFHGIFLSSCVDTDTGLDTISIIYETQDMGLQLLYWPDFDGQVGQVSTDIDLVTGEYWEACEMSDSADFITDGVYIDHAYLEPGNPDWWGAEDAWQGFIFEGAHNPDIAASNGHVYLVFENNGGIVCAHSSNNGDSFSETTIASSGSFPSVTANDQTVTITFIRNGDLYTATSENGGQTWEESSSPVNDESGVVDAQDHSADISGPYVVWTDTRAGNKAVYFEQAGAATPVIEVTSLSGGFGVSAVITNVGGAEGTNIPWSITLEGGLMLLGAEKSGEIASIAPEETVTISTGFILGLGGVDITVSAGGTQKTSSGLVILPFVLGVN